MVLGGEDDLSARWRGDGGLKRWSRNYYWARQGTCFGAGRVPLVGEDDLDEAAPVVVTRG